MVANLAVAVNRDYRAIFPPDIHWASDHAWASTSGFPIVSGDYKGADFGAGRDVRDYNNLPMSASFFTYNSKYDFLGGYDFGAHSGTIHIADRHVAPGKRCSHGAYRRLRRRGMTNSPTTTDHISN